MSTEQGPTSCSSKTTSAKSPQKICCEAARYNNYISGTEVLLFIAEKPAISSAKPIPVPSKPQTVAKPHIEVSNQFALY